MWELAQITRKTYGMKLVYSVLLLSYMKVLGNEDNVNR